MERVEESEKWVTRPQGGEKKNFGRKNDNDWWEGKKSETRFKKT